jgi:hypothetical protein
LYIKRGGNGVKAGLVRRGRIGVVLTCLLAVSFGCSDDGTTPTAETPIDNVKFEQYASDSLKVTFSATVSYQRATLWFKEYSTGSFFEEVDEITGSAPREFRVRWADWCAADVGAYISVRLHYGSGGNTEYTWSKRFVPET